MIELTQKKVEHVKIQLNDEEAKAVTIEYIRKTILGDGCYINSKGLLEHWTSYPHGSGTTTIVGEPTELQSAASALLKLLQ